MCEREPPGYYSSRGGVKTLLWIAKLITKSFVIHYERFERIQCMVYICGCEGEEGGWVCVGVFSYLEFELRIRLLSWFQGRTAKQMEVKQVLCTIIIITFLKID